MDNCATARKVWSKIRRSWTNKERFERYFRKGKATECWNWQAHCFSDSGYGCFGWRDKRNEPITRSIGAHVAAYLLYKGKIPKGKQVQHTCDNRPCVNPNHLKLGTQKDNMRDCIERRRIARGKRQGLSVMTDAKVKELRSWYAAGESQVSLAARFGISQPTVSQITRGITWTHTL